MLKNTNWYCFIARPQHEHAAIAVLENAGAETLAPQFSDYQKVCCSTRRVTRYLFGSYFFAHCDLGYVAPHVKRTWDIRDVVRLGMEPQIVPVPVIDEIRSRILPDGFIHLRELKADDHVVIDDIDSIYNGIEGVFVRHLTTDERVIILFNAVNGIHGSIAFHPSSVRLLA